MARTTISVEQDSAAKLRRIKKITRLPLGRIADIGIGYLEPKIIGGELVAVNGKLVPAAEGSK